MRRWLMACVFLISSPLLAQEWPRFRGPNGGGSGQANLPLQWTEKDFAWKTAIPGGGHSSPIIWGDKIFLTSGDSKTGQRIVLAVQSDGKIAWSKEFAAKPYGMHLRNSVATGTPAVDADRVYAAFSTPDQFTVIALDHSGKVSWQVDLGRYSSQHGFGSSLVVHEDLLIVPNEQDGGGWLHGLDKATGQERWKVKRNSGNATYSTPCVYQRPGGKPELIFTNWKHGITSLEPATGKVNWEVSCFAPELKERAVASPVIAGDLILGTCGFVTAQKHFVAIRPGVTGKPEEVWRIEKQVSYLPTPLVKGNRVFACSELGFASCIDVADGKVIWQERVPGGGYSASPICVGDRLYCVSNEGEVLVLAAADQFQVLARNSLGEATQSTPAIGHGRIYFRTKGHLIGIGGR